MCVLEFLFSKFAGNIPVCNLPGNLPREICLHKRTTFLSTKSETKSHKIPMDTPRVFHVKSTWKPPFQRLQCGMHMMCW